MDDTFRKLLAEAMALSPEDRERLATLIADSIHTQGVRDAGPRYGEPFPHIRIREINGMTSVTIVLPDDLARQAQAAGLLAETRLAELIRHALNEHDANQSDDSGRSRRLIRRNGRLIVEALPGEVPITDEDVRDILNKVEW